VPADSAGAAVNPQEGPALSAAATARIGYVNALRKATGGTKSRPLAETVQQNLTELWEHGGHQGVAEPRRPEQIVIRPDFVVRPATDPLGPMLPRLVKSKGLQLRLHVLDGGAARRHRAERGGVGAGVVVLAGVTIGDRALVGAGAVYGVPAPRARRYWAWPVRPRKPGRTDTRSSSCGMRPGTATDMPPPT
jgi:hypothetical protein